MTNRDSDDLYGVLLAASRFEVTRRQAALADPEDAEDIARRAADKALRTVRNRLDEFHGQSNFSTWASKFALREAAKDIRCRAWQERRIFDEPASWSLPGAEALHDAVEHDLSDRQRALLVATAINEVPIDVVAERLGRSRGAVYASIQSARDSLRAALTKRSLSADKTRRVTHDHVS